MVVSLCVNSQSEAIDFATDGPLGDFHHPLGPLGPIPTLQDIRVEINLGKTPHVNISNLP